MFPPLEPELVEAAAPLSEAVPRGARNARAIQKHKQVTHPNWGTLTFGVSAIEKCNKNYSLEPSLQLGVDV